MGCLVTLFPLVRGLQACSAPLFLQKPGIVGFPSGCWGRKGDEKGLNCGQQEATGQPTVCCPLPGSAPARPPGRETWLGALSCILYVLPSIASPPRLQVAEERPLFHRDCGPW